MQSVSDMTPFLCPPNASKAPQTNGLLVIILTRPSALPTPDRTAHCQTGRPYNISPLQYNTQHYNLVQYRFVYFSCVAQSTTAHSKVGTYILSLPASVAALTTGWFAFHIDARSTECRKDSQLILISPKPFVVCGLWSGFVVRRGHTKPIQIPRKPHSFIRHKVPLLSIDYCIAILCFVVEGKWKRVHFHHGHNQHHANLKLIMWVPASHTKPAFDWA